MDIRITRSRWFNYFVQVLTLAFLIGLFGGVVVSLFRGWKYVSNGLMFPFLDTLKLGISEGVFIAFFFIVFFLVLFLILNRVLQDTKRASFVSAGVILFPFFLFLGYKINKAYISGIFELKAIIWNLVMAGSFVLLWFLVMVGSFHWTKSKIEKNQRVSMKPLSMLVGIVLILNVSAYLFYNFYTSKRNSPNVIILLVDCLRADHLSSYGYNRKTTPNIDQFAKDSVMFTQPISHSSFTKTSIASLFTSRYPFQHGVYWANQKDEEGKVIYSDVLSEEETTLAEVLLQNGMLTVAWLEQPQLLSWMGFAQGFIDYNERQVGIENINKKFTEWIKEVGNRHPFFAYIHYLDLHEPYDPQPPYDTMYGVYNKSIYSGLDLKNWSTYREQINKKERKFEKRDVEQLRAYYDGLLTYVDYEIGVLFKELKEMGLYDRTLIILTADHGDAFWEHGFISHGNILYDELIVVPLIIKFPDARYAGKVIKNQVQLVDVMPTILDFLKLRVDVNLEGLSLMNYFDDAIDQAKEIVSPRHAYSEHYGVFSIRTERFKYIYLEDKKHEFYDLALDPKEQRNLLDVRPKEVNEFYEMALAVVSERKLKKHDDVKRVILDKDTIEELKSLGYIQ